MDFELIFTLVNAAVLPFWLLLLVAPFSKVTHLVVHSGLAALLLGPVYIFFIILGTQGGSPEGAGMNSLAALQLAFSQPEALLAGWVHYLVFDLFVGAWIIRDARRHEIPHLAVVLPALLTFITGPFGLLLYVLLRAGWKQKFTLLESSAA